MAEREDRMVRLMLADARAVLDLVHRPPTMHEIRHFMDYFLDFVEAASGMFGKRYGPRLTAEVAFWETGRRFGARFGAREVDGTRTETLFCCDIQRHATEDASK